MKISGGGNPLPNMGRTDRSKKTKGSQKKAFAEKVEKSAAVSGVESVDAVDEVDSPVYDAMASASSDFESGRATLEEATRAVVSAVIREHFGKKNLPASEVERITLVVTESIGADESLRSRLESTLQRITSERKGTR